MDRRTFIRDTGLLAAALLGVALPGVLFAQDQAAAQKDKVEDSKAPAKTDGKSDPPADQNAKTDDKASDKKEEQKDAKAGSSNQDPFKETRKDDKGNEYRLCPQCGYNMYRQEKTWTCENCGYSYSE